MMQTNVENNKAPVEPKKKIAKTPKQMRQFFIKKMPNIREQIISLSNEQVQKIY